MSPVTHSSLLVSSITALLLLAQAPLSVNAHIKMITPPPLRGENNPQYDWSSYDYSMTNPLLEDGSNFACKGYQSDVPGKSHAVATVKAGQQFEVALDGSATHGGGSCQFSLSYDNGQTFGVVHSVIGGCPLEKKYSFKIPSNVPAGKDVLLAWTWFNKVGNREMYMNCAAINIESSSTSSIQLPSVFRANTFGGSCHTVEGDELVFPNPGASVVYGGKWAGQKPGKDALQLNGCSSDQISDKFVTLKSNTGASSPGYGNGNDGGEDKPEPTVDEPVKTAAPTVEAPVVVVPSSSASSIKPSLAPIRGGAAKTQTVTSSSQAATSSTATVSTSSSASASVSPSSCTKLASSRGDATTKSSSAPVTGETPGVLCTGNGLKCSEDGGSFSVCADGRWVSMGLVAPGTTCKNGKIGFTNIAAPDSCTPGSLKCSNDGKSFSVCNTDGEGYTSMGRVAPGTICQNGKIAAASTKRSMNNARNAKRHGPRRLSHSS